MAYFSVPLVEHLRQLKCRGALNVGILNRRPYRTPFVPLGQGIQDSRAQIHARGMRDDFRIDEDEAGIPGVHAGSFKLSLVIVDN